MKLPVDTIAIPLVSEADAKASCQALRPFLSSRTEVIVVHVIQKAGGGIDPVSMDRRKAQATQIFEKCSQVLDKDVRTITTTITFQTDIVEGIREAGRDYDADIIAFTPRGASRIRKLISGDTAFKLVHRAERPVLIIPQSEYYVPEENENQSRQ